MHKLDRKFHRALKALCVYLAMLASIQTADAQGARHAVLIGGLGGTPEHSARFERFLSESRRGLIEQFGFKGNNVFVLGETAIEDRDFVRASSTAENIEALFHELANVVQSEDDVYVFLFGHGSFDGTNAQLNIPRKDLDDADYDKLLAGLNAKRIVFVNTASSSGPFVGALSMPGRIIITATRTGTERNETTFPIFFVEALTTGAADLDRNGEITVAEVFRFASEKTKTHFEESNHLATEHALLDDNGDANGSEVDRIDDGGDGAVAAVTRLRDRDFSLASIAPENRTNVSQMLQEKERLEIEVAELKAIKAKLTEEEYYSRLETVFVSLARLNNSIERGSN